MNSFIIYGELNVWREFNLIYKISFLCVTYCVFWSVSSHQGDFQNECKYLIWAERITGWISRAGPGSADACLRCQRSTWAVQGRVEAQLLTSSVHQDVQAGTESGWGLRTKLLSSTQIYRCVELVGQHRGADDTLLTLPWHIKLLCLLILSLKRSSIWGLVHS